MKILKRKIKSKVIATVWHSPIYSDVYKIVREINNRSTWVLIRLLFR